MTPLMLLLPAVAAAYETDQLTHRHEALADAAPAANAKMDAILADAIVSANARTRCSAPTDEARLVLAEEIAARTAGLVRVPERGALRSFGFGQYAAWLETDPSVERHEFDDREDIYGQLRLVDSVVLRVAGPASTVRIGDVLLGTDKLDHFLAEGHMYLWLSDDGEYESVALWYGTASERGWYGLLSSQTFSYADLKANYEGYQFYRGLLTDGSVVELGDDGCAVQARPFRWEEWVDAGYDEVLNPSVYQPAVERAVRDRGIDDVDAVCRDWLAAETDLDTIPEYATWGAPPRRDPFGLRDACDDSVVVDGSDSPWL